MIAADFESLEVRVAAFVLSQQAIPAHPRPLKAGWESINWRCCPLADMYGLPGETMPLTSRSKRVWP